MKKATGVIGALLCAGLFLLSGCGDAEEQPTPTVTQARPTSLPTVVAVATPDCVGQFFEETKRTVCQPFLQYWQEHGGLAIYGFPITDQIQETEGSATYTAQYFERARFELHPNLGNAVALGRLGAIIQKKERAAQPLPDTTFFQETGHNLGGPFLRYWTEKGGLAVFGFPLTEEKTETNQTDNKEYKVQYFERARFELHPEFAGTPYEVQLGQLGRQVYKSKYRR